MSKENARLFFTLVLLGLSIYGVKTNYPAIRGVLFSDASSFSTTTGTILHSRHTSERAHGTTVGGYDILYSYEVNGHRYTSNSVDFKNDNSDWQTYINRYRKGDSVEVFYEIGDPEYAVLLPNEKSYLVFFSPLIMLMFAAGVWIKMR
ncbi:hypothetical protein A3758_17640 [Oleiphilus sp. HI0118]|nr:hypothetical protein A3758_18540 [Oleiphilus sp. HI0118]KZZ47100.1 hypothetical protein A3758_17640 [Oleiphilus sp. HI0118]